MNRYRIRALFVWGGTWLVGAALIAGLVWAAYTIFSYWAER